MSVLIVGSVALDHVKTPVEEKANLLGGAAAYASVAASFSHRVNCVGIVGKDFPEEHLHFLASRSIDLEGLKVVEGKTFRWSGEYLANMNCRETRSLELNVFENFSPLLPERYRSSPFVLLGNIAPTLQQHVLDQVEAPQFVIANTIDFWIETARDEFLKLLKRIDMLILNEHEAQLLTGTTNLIRAGRLLRELGPRFIIINKGEHGSLLFGENAFFSCPAYPLEEVHDPTGAGDSFAGGLIGYLASTTAAGQNNTEITFEQLRSAVVYGTVLASFNLESFSMDRFRTLTQSEIEERLRIFRLMGQCNSAPAGTIACSIVPSPKAQSTVFSAS